MNKKDKIVIVGTGEHGRMMYNFFTCNTDFEIVAFAVEKKYRKESSFFGLPVVDFEDIVQLYPPQSYMLFIAITYVKLNRERKRLYLSAKELGYRLATYIDPSSTVDRTASIGENVAIFENNVIQYHSIIENNVVMQAGGVVAHGSHINEHAWLAPCVSVAGFAEVGSCCFLGINCTIADDINVVADTIIGAGAVVYKSITKKGVYVGNPCRLINESTAEYFS